MTDKNPGDPARGTRWSQIGGTSGRAYAERFAALAAAGEHVHGEADFCASLLTDPTVGPVLDAGCGTGRVAIRLAELGFRCVGVDVDDSMLEAARTEAPHLPWHRADLASLTSDDLAGARDFDLVVMAGNVVPLLGEGTLASAMRSLARLVAPAGRLVAGFGLDTAHLPPGCPVTPLEEYDAAARDAGLTSTDRYSTWERGPYSSDSGYAVSVHRKPPLG